MDQSFDKNHFFSVLESVLFAHGEPLPLEKLADILGQEPSVTRQVVSEYAERLRSDPGSGTILLIQGEEVQLGTKPENFPFLEKFFKKDAEEDLSPAAAEVLSLILYRGPILRSEIDFIRGVNSSYILRMLAMRGLVTRDKHGLSFAYRPSFDLLKWLGVATVQELPDFEILNQRLDNLVDSENQGGETLENQNGTG